MQVMHLVEWLRRSLIVLLMLCALPASGAEEVQAVPRVTTRLTDVPGVMPEARRAALEAKLEKLARVRGLHIGIVLVATTRPESPEAYGARVVDAWRSGVTGGKDGVLLLIAKDDGRVFLDVGRVRAVMPYKEGMRLVMGIMAPHFERGDYATGIAAGIQAMADYVEAEEKSKGQQSTTFEWSNALADVDHRLSLLLLGAVVVAGVLGRLIGRMLAGMVGGGAAAWLVWMLVPVGWIAIACGALVFFLVLGTPPGKSLRVLGQPSSGAGGTAGASGDWAR